MLEWEEFQPRPFSGRLSVRWLRSADGRWYGKEFYQAEKQSRGGFASKAMQMAIKGRIGWIKRNGHPILEDVAEGAFMLRASKQHEYFGFEDDGAFYVAHGGNKKTKKGQQKDYAVLRRIMQEYFDAKRKRS